MGTSTAIAWTDHTFNPSPDALTDAEQRVLDAMAWWSELGFDEPTKIQVGVIAGYRVSKKVGGTYGAILGRLRSLSFLEYGRPGRAAAAPVLFVD